MCETESKGEFQGVLELNHTSEWDFLSAGGRAVSFKNHLPLGGNVVDFYFLPMDLGGDQKYI